jgi:hypothetical protein
LLAVAAVDVDLKFAQIAASLDNSLLNKDDLTGLDMAQLQ